MTQKNIDSFSAVLSATGTGFMVDKFGWNGALSFWIASAVICIVICAILWKNETAKKYPRNSGKIKSKPL